MARLRLRSKFLLSLLLISSAVTFATLLIVHHTVLLRVRKELAEELRNSVITFQDFQQEREASLTRSAELLANLPDLKALMTTRDAPTIQDASRDLWTLAGSDLFVLADRTGKVVALHTTSPGFSRSSAQEMLQRSILQDQPNYWWFGGGHLYEVFLQPIYFGAPAENKSLGLLAVGHEIDDRVAKEVSRVASSQVAFRYENQLVISTLPSGQEGDFVRQLQNPPQPSAEQPKETKLGEEQFLATSLALGRSGDPAVYLDVLKSYDQATLFLSELNRLLLALGVIAVAAGCVLAFLISDTFTRPLASLVAGVRALETGDFTYPLEISGTDEAAELARAFDRMRHSLQKAQQQLVATERLATIGRMASSISHDLRHPLTAIVANAEFLCEQTLNGRRREDLYQEVRVAVDQVTDLIESLLEFSRAREHLRPVYGSVRDTVQRVVTALHARPEFSSVRIEVSCEGRGEGWFDPKKMERAFQNLLLNACEAVPADGGKVEVNILDATDGLEIRVADNGPGIPESIRDKLFQPFVSCGKEKGTGLGLTIVQKISQDHGGEVCVESTSAARTVFKLRLPHKGLSDLLSPG
jgi:signal transduction histidine kinase